MAKEKNVLGRFGHKHDTEVNWKAAVGFIPLNGELVVYDPDETYTYKRFKFGDGVTNVNDLPFFGDFILDKLLGKVDLFMGTKEQYDAAFAAGLIANGSLVIITDGNTETTAKLGLAKLGQMILGQE